MDYLNVFLLSCVHIMVVGNCYTILWHWYWYYDNILSSYIMSFSAKTHFVLVARTKVNFTCSWCTWSCIKNAIKSYVHKINYWQILWSILMTFILLLVYQNNDLNISCIIILCDINTDDRNAYIWSKKCIYFSYCNIPHVSIEIDSCHIKLCT